MTRSGKLTVVIPIALSAISLLAVVATAWASSPRRHAYKATVRVVQFSAHNATITSVGFENSSLGQAMVSSMDTLERRIRGTTYGFREVSRHYFPNGGFTARATGTVTLNPDGTATSPPMVEKIVSGTGRFRGAAGKWTLTGTTRRPGQIRFTYHLKGIITY